MHASLEQLISLRDSEPVSADAAVHVRGCAECGHALGRLAAWRQRLRGLPEFNLPENSWRWFTARLDQPARHGRWRPAAGIGLVASLVAAVALVTWHTPAPVPVTSTVSIPPALAELQSQSRYLENAVQSLNAAGDQQIVNAGSAATVAALEDRIALVDYAINRTAARPQAEEALTQLWQQRVDLMQSLVAVRYAQASAVDWVQ